jgi:glycosyltransferase involved in cell wall biosynthesis
MAALEWWRDQVRPLLDAQGGEDIVLTVVGSCSMRQRDSLEDARLRFTGYLPDLADELRAHRAMVAPVTSGTGMKTKVLDGFSVGLPVVATSLGVAGLAVRDGQEALVSDDPAGFAASVLRLRDDPAMAAAIGIAGRSLLRSTWSSETLVERWRQVIADVLTPNGAQGRSQPPV